MQYNGKNMAEEKQVGFKDWVQAYREFEEYADLIEEAQKRPQIANLAALAAQNAGEHLEAQHLAEDEHSGGEYLKYLQIGATQKQKTLEELSSSDNLGDILDGFETPQLEQIMGLYKPSVEHVSQDYAEAAAIYGNLIAIQDFAIRAQKGDITSKEEQNNKPLIMAAISNAIDEEFKDNEGPEYDLIKEARLSLAKARPEYRLQKFVELAPGIIEKQKVKFYEKIGGEDNLIDYMEKTINDGEILGLYKTIYESSKNAQQRQ